MSAERYINDFKVQKAKALNKYYDPTKKCPQLYTLTDGNWTLYNLDLQVGYFESDHPEDYYWYSERDMSHGVLFWAKSDTPEEALKELSNRMVAFVDTIKKRAKDLPPHKHFEKIVNSPNDYPEACDAWVKSISIDLANVSGDIQSVFELITDFQYKYRKHCELFKNLIEFCEDESVIDFLTKHR